MPIGVIIDVAVVILGGLAGGVFGSRLPENMKQQMNLIFGVCALGMGISSIVLMANMPAAVFSVVAGTMVGLALKIGASIQSLAEKVLNKFQSNENPENSGLMLTAFVLFCAGGTGIYGALDSGMTGDHSILIAKAVLDFFTAMIFACQLGKVVAFIGLPQLVVLGVLFCLAKIILPLTNESMIRDFKACGGFLLLATGVRMMKLQALPIADMIPAMVIVMPVSYCWTQWILPLIG